MKYVYLILALAVLISCVSAISANKPPRDEVREEPVPAGVIPTDPPEEPQPQPTQQTQPLPPADPLEALLYSMSIEERVGQLFLARYSGSSAQADARQYHLGGYILFGKDFDGKTPQDIRGELLALQENAAVPMLIAVDEEGGTVTRVSSYRAFRPSPFRSPRSYYAEGGMEAVLLAEEEKAQLLCSLGINVNMGPVCDIALTPGAFMYQRSLGQDAATTAEFAVSTVSLLRAAGVGSVLKHFPGYGSNADTHVGIARDSRPLEQLLQQDLVPFQAAIDADCGAILMSHTVIEALDPEHPATLSEAVHRYLRSEMGFAGVIVTDDLVMGAITESYGAGEAAVLAVLAGNDLLCSTDYPVQYQAVLDAVCTGRIPWDTLNNAVMRVLRWKQQIGLFD